MPATNRFVACAGYGYWGKNLARVFNERGVLHTICDASEASRAAAGKLFPDVRIESSWSEVLKNPSIKAVVIATPAEAHADMAHQALLADKDVFVEKPLTLDVASGEALAQLAKERGRILMVGHLLWYHPAVLKLKELVSRGQLGRIQYIYSNRLNLGKIRREENIFWSFAPHDISVILGLLGEMPTEIIAQGGNYLSAHIADVTMSCLSFPSGAKAHIFVSWLHPFKEQKLVVVGDRQMAVFDDVQPKDKLLLYPHTIEWKENLPVPTKALPQPVEIDASEPLMNECDHFLECVKTRATPRTDAAEALRVLKVLQAGQRALESKQSATNGATRPYSVHSSAFVDEGVTIGKGTSIWHVSHILKGSQIGERCKIGQNVVIGPNAKVGNGVKIQNNVSVYEGVTLEDDVFCGPSMVFTNVHNPRSHVPRMDEIRHTRIRRGATLGANCTIVCGTTVGQYAFVGAGAVVTKDVPDFGLVVGVPARLRGWMCQCGVQLSGTGKTVGCKACGALYQKKGPGLEMKEKKGGR